MEVAGDGPAVVFSGAAAPMMWSRAAAGALAEHGYRVVNFDYGSESDDPVSRSALDQVRDVLDVLDGLEIGSASVVGLSRGAMTTFAMAAEQPERVSCLVLAFPVAGFSDTIGIYQPDPEPEPGEDQADFLKRYLGKVFSQEFLASRLDEAVTLATSPPGEVVRLDRSLEDRFPESMSVACPTLVVEGGADEVVPSEHPARYVRAVPSAEHVVLPGAFHGWLMEEPDEFARIVGGFLSRRWVGLRPAG